LPEPKHADARCPRCGGTFHCGAREASCDCAQARLDDAALAELQQAFEGCLCLACLRAIQAGLNRGMA
jgi:Cysteine-rich CWC